MLPLSELVLLISPPLSKESPEEENLHVFRALYTRGPARAACSIPHLSHTPHGEVSDAVEARLTPKWSNPCGISRLRPNSATFGYQVRNGPLG
ncbi:hypothetical protein Trydic_g11695 [Trypoxylus dichotomus]